MADVKRWIHDAYAMYKTARDGSGGDPVSGRLYGMARNVFLGKIMAAVENQPKPYPELLQFLYAPDYTDTQLHTLKRAAVGAVLRAEQGMGLKPIQERTYLKLLDLAETVMLEYQAEQRGRGKWKMHIVQMMAGINPGNWRKPERRWRERYSIMHRAVHRWELEALEAPRRVAEEIEENREREAG